MDATGIFFVLLRAGLGVSRLPESFEIPQGMWPDILSTARKQAVQGTIYRAASMLREDQMPPVQDRIGLMVEVGKIQKRTQALERVAGKLIGELTGAGLRPIVLKGPEVGKYYPDPSLRISGDVDIYLPEDELHQALEMMAARSINALREPDGAYLFEYKEILIELHSRYFDLHVPAIKLPAVPSAEAELLMLSSHILKHAIGVGIGLRQICDMAMAFRTLEGKYDKEAFLGYIVRTGLKKWNSLLCSFLCDFMGISPSGLPDFKHISPEPLLQVVLSGGNFGQHDAGFKATKSNTVLHFLKRLPFSLCVAPRETFCTMLELAKGNLK